MDNNNLSGGLFKSFDIIVFLYKKKLPLIIVGALAVIASAIFSSPFFITPKFKSTVVMFPAATNSISKVLISYNSGSKDDIMGFGSEEQTEQLLQILTSNKIRSRIIKKYDLMRHYDIDTASKYKYTTLFREYESNIKCRRTEFMAVEIVVLDKDPQMAADIANDIANLLDSVKNEMQRQRAVEGLQIAEKDYSRIKEEVNKMVDSLKSLGKKGINDYVSQAEVLNQQYAIALRTGASPAAIKALKAQLDTLSKYGGAYLFLSDELKYKTEQVAQLKAKYDEAKVDAESFISQKFIIDNAYKAEKKAYPTRWLIVVITTFSALLLTIIVLIILDNFARIKGAIRNS